MINWKLNFASIVVLASATLNSTFAEVGSGRTRDLDPTDPRAIGHRGVLDRPTDVGTSRRSNWHAVEAARDRGAGRIVDEPTWELDRLREDREARRETEVILEDRDRTLRLEARDAQDRRQENRGGVIHSERPLRSGSDESNSPLDAQIMDDEQAMDQARRNISRRLSDLKNSESREVSEAQKKLPSDSEKDQLKAEIERIHAKYKAMREKAMDDYVLQTDRIMGVPEMIEGPIPEKPGTRPATRPADKSPAAKPPALKKEASSKE